MNSNHCLLYTYRLTHWRIPGVITGRPREDIREGCKEEPQRPGYDNVVIEIDVECDQDDSVANTC